MTKREMFERVIEIVKGAGVEDEAILVEKLEHEIELVTKKRTGLTKNQKANIELAERVFEVIANAEKDVTIAEIFDEVKDVEGISSTNKVSALVKKLVDAERVERIDNGSKANKTYKAR